MPTHWQPLPSPPLSVSGKRDSPQPDRAARLLAAAKEALRVLDTFSIDDLMEGKDSTIRAELLGAIRDLDPNFGLKNTLGSK